ncbi:hypothetical protein PENARI_c005G05415 [Penicillium arizonense]|uniref:Uncharacterized protein n=1 Tax=Penicillium arizonense TaxID=1835702 RepID=A0A1F5LNU9_PENAI|nr:hypothetical protein PENARI_c005G05415 [Penicillium arizonense]OGE54797.1 hypothetical protein PENARI_c005G05415 [Penicillium arizonense]
MASHLGLDYSDPKWGHYPLEKTALLLGIVSSQQQSAESGLFKFAVQGSNDLRRVQMQH